MIELNNLPVLELSTKGDTMRDKVKISEKYHCLKLQAMCDNALESCQPNKQNNFLGFSSGLELASQRGDNLQLI